MIFDSVAYLKESGLTVFYDAEHFFDGYKDDPEYAMKTLQAAQKAGADMLILCDTNGGCLPSEIENIGRIVINQTTVPLGIHAHNDSGLANAIALEAYLLGAKMIQGTMNGFGERCGNTDLTTILPTLQIKMGIQCISEEDLKNLTVVSHFVYEMANLPGENAQPFVGKHAFSHKGGIHISAMLKNVKTDKVMLTWRIFVGESKYF